MEKLAHLKEYRYLCRKLKKMKVTAKILNDKFQECRNVYFKNMAGMLPIPTLSVMHSYRKSGEFLFVPVGKRARLKVREIRISDYFDFTEEQLRNILVHEMIHYYIAYNHIEDDAAHGIEFTKIASKLNAEYGLNITEKIDASELTRSEDAPNLSWWFVKIFG